MFSRFVVAAAASGMSCGLFFVLPLCLLCLVSVGGGGRERGLRHVGIIFIAQVLAPAQSLLLLHILRAQLGTSGFFFP